MKRWMRTLCVLLCLMTPCAACAQEEWRARLDQAFRRFNTMGASVAVFQNGEITHTHTYGLRRLGGDPVTEDTLFQVGSISKMVANIGLMQLLEEQAIPLDTPLGDVLGYAVLHPEYPDAPITLRQLMTHTASLRDGGAYDLALSGDAQPLSTLMDKQGASVFFSGQEPGTKRQYSNFGGGLIGCLIEKLSGETLDECMQRRVFGPLGVTAAYHVRALDEALPAADIYRMPSKYLGKVLRQDQTLVAEPDPERHYTFTAGKLIISAPDLAKILIALCDGGIYQNTRLLRESTVQEMTTRQDYRGSVRCESGNGLFMNIITDHQVEGRTLYGHGGRAYGMLCAAYFDPVDRTGVVMLTNGCRSDAVYNGVGMLGRVALTLCYDELINPAHQRQDPFAVQ